MRHGIIGVFLFVFVAGLAKVQQDGHRLLLVVGKPKYIKVLKAEEAT